jgi:hypothetical protein
MKAPIVALAVLAGFVPHTYAANFWSWDITYSNPSGRILAPGDSATVTLWAHFDDNLYALADAALDVFTGDSSGSWSDLGVELDNGLEIPGAPDGGDVTGILGQQFYDPLADLWPDTSNPIRVWHGTFTVSDFTPRVDPLETVTSAFQAYNEQVQVFNLLDSLDEGAGGIKIGVPTPGAPAIIALGALLAPRQRRGALP